MRALHNRGLVKVEGSGRTWAAKVTADGERLLREGAGRDRPGVACETPDTAAGADAAALNTGGARMTKVAVPAKSAGSKESGNRDGLPSPTGSFASTGSPAAVKVPFGSTCSVAPSLSVHIPVTCAGAGLPWSWDEFRNRALPGTTIPRTASSMIKFIQGLIVATYVICGDVSAGQNAAQKRK